MNEDMSMNDYELQQGVNQLQGIIHGFQNELASLLWVDTLEARQREQTLLKAIIAHTQAIDEIESQMTC
jgi:hypothetical protein